MFDFLKDQYNVVLEAKVYDCLLTGESFKVGAESINEAIYKARDLLDKKYGRHISIDRRVVVNGKVIMLD